VIIDIIISADAWIVTCSSDAHLMKYVGQSIKESKTSCVTAIGITPWGCLTGGNRLQHPEIS